MIPQDLFDLAQVAFNVQREEQARRGVPHAGGASIFLSPGRLASWAIRTASSLGDPAVGPEDLIQEVMQRIMQGDAVAVGGNPAWVYGLLVKQQDFLELDYEVASSEVPMSDLVHDMHLILSEEERAAVELSLEQDLSRTQIAELLLTSDREVRRLLRSARMKIAAYLHGYKHV